LFAAMLAGNTGLSDTTVVQPASTAAAHASAKTRIFMTLSLPVPA
jgi:hypothetical protein